MAMPIAEAVMAAAELAEEEMLVVDVVWLEVEVEVEPPPPEAMERAEEPEPAETISPFSSVIIGGGRVVLVQSSTGTDQSKWFMNHSSKDSLVNQKSKSHDLYGF